MNHAIDSLAGAMSVATRIELVVLLQQQYMLTAQLHCNLQLAQWLLRRFSFRALRKVLRSMALMAASQLSRLAHPITGLGGYLPCANTLVFDNIASLGFSDCIAQVLRDLEELERLADCLNRLLEGASITGEWPDSLRLEDTREACRLLVARIRHVLAPDAEFASAAVGVADQ
ncbi:hypothetical protein [Pseudomonas sp. GZD-222]|uniref:hypothetical protein n=1 Tax=Pseudomonas sp. GZD-222 TaxID=3404805 RepID=UPI003BB6E0C7